MTMIASDHLSPCTSNIDDHFPAYMARGNWQPTRTGDYAADCQHGRDLAEDIANRVSLEQNPLHFSVVAQAIVESGRWEAVEIGLFSRLGMFLG